MPANYRRRAVVFTSPQTVEVIEKPFEFGVLLAKQALVQTIFTVVSAGTELAVLRGTESWAPLPFEPGYGAIGKVLEIGPDVTDLAVGDRVFYYGCHASLNIVDTEMAFKVPDGIDDKLVTLGARMGQVAFTAPRIASAQLGDVVAVVGMGLVGNLSAQLFKLSGCTVVGLDVSPNRLAAAHDCGIEHVVNTRTTDPVAAINRISGGEMCYTVVEATGIPAMVEFASALSARNGEVILLGSPRGEFTGNATALLDRIHLAKSHVTLRGAHEWVFPFKTVEGKHSLSRNVVQLMALVGSGKLKVAPLITHVVAPSEAPEVYKNLTARNEDYFGVLIDWSKA